MECVEENLYRGEILISNTCSCFYFPASRILPTRHVSNFLYILSWVVTDNIPIISLQYPVSKHCPSPTTFCPSL